MTVPRVVIYKKMEMIMWIRKALLLLQIDDLTPRNTTKLIFLRPPRAKLSSQGLSTELSLEICSFEAKTTGPLRRHRLLQIAFPLSAVTFFPVIIRYPLQEPEV